MSQLVARGDGRVFLKVKGRNGVCLAWRWGRHFYYVDTCCGDAIKASETEDAPTCLTCLHNYELLGSGFPETNEVATYRFKYKDQLFEETKQTGAWPAKTCVKCKNGCCMRTWHHVGDCCLHCGNDERPNT